MSKDNKVSNTTIEISRSDLNLERESQSNFFRSFLNFRNSAFPLLSQTYTRAFLIWLLIYFVLCGFLTWQVSKLVKKYFEYPTDVSIEIVFESEIDFPAVTVCNESPLRKSLIERQPYYKDLIHLEAFAFSSTLANLNLDIKCPDDSYHQCNDSGVCVAEEWICNGINHCEDGSDEMYPPYNCSEMVQQRMEKHTQDQQYCRYPYIACPEEYRCANPCDNLIECTYYYGYDEENCDEGASRTRREPSELPPPESENPFEKQFRTKRSAFEEEYSYYEYDYYNSYDYYIYSLKTNKTVPNDYFRFYKESVLSDLSDFRRKIFLEDYVLQANGFEAEHFIVQCVFDGEPCDHKSFTTYQEPYFGNCHTFNSIKHQNHSEEFQVRRTRKSGQANGLKVTLFLDVDDYLGILAPSASARLMIHNPYLEGDVRGQSFAVSPGERVLVALKMHEIERLGGKYGNCSEDWPEFLKLNDDYKKSAPIYDRETCMFLCQQNALSLRCGCTDSFTCCFSSDHEINKGTWQYCNLMDSDVFECRQGVLEDAHNHQLDCNCPNACLTLGLQGTVSTSNWPTETFSAFVLHDMVTLNSSRLRRYLGNILEHTEVTRTEITEEIKRNFAHIEVFFEALNFERISEEPAYDVTALLSDFGGNTGLWLGWSVLIAFELIQFAFECMKIATLKLLSKSKDH